MTDTNTHAATDSATDEPAQAYDHVGTMRGSDYVVTDDGEEYYLPPSEKRFDHEPLHSRRVAFNADPMQDIMLSDRVTEWEVIDSTPSMDAFGRVVYTHGGTVFLEVEGCDEDVRAYQSNIYGEVEEGATVLFDWHTKPSRIWHAEVVDEPRAEFLTEASSETPAPDDQ